MFRKWKKLLCVIMIVVLGVGTMQYIELTPTVQAISAKQKQKKKALKAYKKLLKKSKVTIGDTKVNTADLEFWIYDLNHDGTPELLLRNSGNLYLYTYYAGKMRSNMVANLFAYYKKGSVFSCASYTGSTFYEGINKIVKGKVKTVAHSMASDEGIGSYYIGKKKVSKKKYKAYVKKMTKKSSSAEPKLHKVTKGNIKKYLK